MIELLSAIAGILLVDLVLSGDNAWSSAQQQQDCHNDNDG